MAKKRYEADYVLNLNKTITSLKNAKEQAEQFDDIMSSIGNRGNFNDLIKYFLGLDDAIDELRQSTDELMAGLGDSLKGGYVASLDAVFGKLADLSKLSQNLFKNLGSLDLTDPSAAKKLEEYANILNTVFDSLGVKKKINLENFLTKPLEEQRQYLVQFAKGLNKEINTSLGNINIGSIRDEFENAFDGAAKPIQEFSAEVQAEIDKLEKQNRKLEKLKERLNDTAEIAKKVNSKGGDAVPSDLVIKKEDLSPENISKVLDEYDALNKEVQSGTLSVEDYTEKIIKLTEIAMQLKKAFSDIKNDNVLSDAFKNANSSGRNDANLFNTLRRYSGGTADKFAQLIKASQDGAIGEQISNNLIDIENLKTGNVNKAIISYEELVSKIKELDDAMTELNAHEDDEDSTIYDEKAEYVEELKDDFLELVSACKQYADIQETISKLVYDRSIDKNQAIDNIAELLGISSEQVSTPAVSAGVNTNQTIANLDKIKNDLEQIHDLAFKTNKELSFSVGANGIKYVVESTEGMVRVVDEAATAVNSLNNGLTILAHSHPGGNGYFSVKDVQSALNSKSVGHNSPIMAMGKNMASVLDLSGVSDEVINQVQNKLSSLSGIIGPKVFKELQEIFASGGFTNALKTFDISDSMDELSNHLLKVGQSAEASTSPLEKFKAQLIYFSGGKVNKQNLDSFQSYWDDFNSGAKTALEIFNEVMAKVGATDTDGNILKIDENTYKSLEVAAKNIIVGASEPINVIGNTIQDTTAKLQEMRNLADNISGKFGADMLDDISIGKYQEKLNNAREELKLLGDQGVITAGELEAVEQALDVAAHHLDTAKQENENQRAYKNGPYAYSYEYEYENAENANRDLRNDNDELKEKNRLLEQELEAKKEILAVTEGERDAARAAADEANFYADQMGRRVFEEELRADQEKERADALEETVALLQKEKLAYEEVLTLVKAYNDETQMKAAADTGDWDTYDKILNSHVDIARKLVPTSMMGIGSDSPDNWLAMVGMSAEEAAQKLYELHNRLDALHDADGLVDTTQNLGVEIPEAADKAKNSIEDVKQEVEYFDTPTGQMSIFENMSGELQEAESNAEELKDTLKEIDVLDGQISFDDIESQKISEANEELKEYQDLKDKIDNDINGRGQPPIPSSGGDTSLSDSGDSLDKVYKVHIVADDTLIAETINAKFQDYGTNQQPSLDGIDIASLSSSVLKAASTSFNPSELQLGSFTRTKDGLNQVTGVFKDAEGIWKGFTAKVNDANEVVRIGIQKQSAFADALNKTNNATDEATNKNQKSAIDMARDYYIEKGSYSDKQIDFYSEKMINKALSNAFNVKIDGVGDPTGKLYFSKAFGGGNTPENVAEMRKEYELYDQILQQIGYHLEEWKETEDIQGFSAKIVKNAENYVDNLEQARNILFGIGEQIEENSKKEQDADNKKKNKKTSIPSIKSAQDKYDVLSNKAKQYISEDSNIYSNIVKTQLDQYTTALNNLKAAQQDLNTVENLSEQELRDKESAFAIAKASCTEYAQKLDALIKSSEKFRTSHENIIDVDKNNYDVSNIKEAKQALENYVIATYGANAKIGQFDDSLRALKFTIKDADGATQEMTASFDATGTAIGAAVDKAKQSATTFSSFFSDISKKSRELISYFTARFGVDEIFQQIRNGIQYIRDIDSALTELKKVTDETDATYQKFLQTASKTAGVVGSTVKDFTNATADFARLGYNINEASQLAEASLIYKNVGDGFSDVSEASESIISTMKAFGIEATDTMGIVDRFNEVGKYIAQVV